MHFEPCQDGSIVLKDDLDRVLARVSANPCECGGCPKLYIKVLSEHFYAIAPEDEGVAVVLKCPRGARAQAQA